MVGRPVILIVHDSQSQLEALERSARAILGEAAEIETARDAERGQAALGETAGTGPAVVIVDLGLPEKQHYTAPSRAVGRKMAQEAAEDADRRGLKRLVIQYTGTDSTQCASGTKTTPVRHFTAGESDLFARVQRWLADERACDDLPCGAWDAEAHRLVGEIHSLRHDTVTPFLAIDMDLQTLAGLLERKIEPQEKQEALGPEDVDLLRQVMKALRDNAAVAPMQAQTAWTTLKGIIENSEQQLSVSLDEDQSAAAAWEHAQGCLTDLKSRSAQIAKATDSDWETVAEEQSVEFQQALIDLRDDLETVVQYFEERLTKAGKSEQ
jgi:hypothetical protein